MSDAASTDDFVRYCCGDPDCPNDCEREQPPASSAATPGIVRWSRAYRKRDWRWLWLRTKIIVETRHG